MITPSHKLSVRRQCELLELHRSGIYYTPVGESEENLQLMRKLDERHLHYPTEGVLQLQDYFRDEGLRVNHKRIRRLMRKMGIRAQYPRRTLTKLGKAEYIHPYLLRNRKIERPNEAWAIDMYPADQTILTSGVVQASFAEKLISYARTQRKDVGAGIALA